MQVQICGMRFRLGWLKWKMVGWIQPLVKTEPSNLEGSFEMTLKTEETGNINRGILNEGKDTALSFATELERYYKNNFGITFNRLFTDCI